MEGLLLRLSALDADAENAVRVIGFFDSLVARKVGLETLLRNASALAECPIGVHVPGQGVWLRADPRGEVCAAGRTPAGAAKREFDDGLRCWLERSGAALPLDEMLLERFAIAVALVLDRPRGALPELGDPALLELALADSAGEAERSRALHLMGLTPVAPIRVLALDPGGEAIPALDDVRSAALGAWRAVLLPGHDDPAGLVPAGVRAGIGPRVNAIDAPGSWRDARSALRFTDAASMPIVWAEGLGGLALLADKLGAADIAGVTDVAALDRLAAEPTGADLLAVLQAFCATGSVRKAATAVYRHHSTIATRMVHAEEVLGFALDSPHGRFRLHLALLLRRLRDSAP
ncbi:helix-turn-helix domain-containing protein [Amycolatopsis anabasis]|uniref:helix-turn-helix domain-containing protein n=1 Tax=Amycolatopsis anabasis TaxID=1840409 RepID=UPI00131B7BD9|nr:helix-turn-helix domain-containing protein [Amycolatopsis anabasis]